MQVGKFLKNIKRAGQNRSAGGKFSGKSINVQIKIKPSRGEFFLKINKRACTSIRYTRVVERIRYLEKKVAMKPQTSLIASSNANGQCKKIKLHVFYIKPFRKDLYFVVISIITHQIYKF